MQVNIRKQHSKDRIISFGQIVVKSDCFETKIIQNIQFCISVSKEQSTHKGNVFIHKKIKHQMSMKLVRHKDERTDSRKKKFIVELNRKLLASQVIFQVLETGAWNLRLVRRYFLYFKLKYLRYNIFRGSVSCRVLVSIPSNITTACWLSEVQPEHRSHCYILFICDILCIRHWTKPDCLLGLSSVSTLCIIII